MMMIKLTIEMMTMITQSFLDYLSLPQTTNFRFFQTKKIADDNSKFNENGGEFHKRTEKRCWKRRNCSLQAISSFPTVLLTDLYCSHVKTRAYLGKD